MDTPTKCFFCGTKLSYWDTNVCANEKCKAEYVAWSRRLDKIARRNVAKRENHREQVDSQPG